MCPNCGNPIQPGTTVCPYCNTQLQQQPVQPMNQPMGQPVQPVQPMPPMNQPMGQPMPAYNQPKSSAGKIVLFVIIGIVVIIAIAIVVLLSGSKKLTCKKGSETITLRYTDKQVVACSHIGGNAICELDEIQKLVDTYGVEKVISSLESELTAAGYSCSR